MMHHARSVRRAKRENARNHPAVSGYPLPGPQKETGERKTQHEEMAQQEVPGMVKSFQVQKIQ